MRDRNKTPGNEGDNDEKAVFNRECDYLKAFNLVSFSHYFRKYSYTFVGYHPSH